VISDIVMCGSFKDYLPVTMSNRVCPSMRFVATRHVSRASLLSLIILMLSSRLFYNWGNTAATPLNNAQPWWLFYARDLRKVKGAKNEF
jgi:hypothetical protein